MKKEAECKGRGFDLIKTDWLQNNNFKKSNKNTIGDEICMVNDVLAAW